MKPRAEYAQAPPDGARKTAEHLKLLRECNQCSKLFMAIPWQTSCSSCELGAGRTKDQKRLSVLAYRRAGAGAEETARRSGLPIEKVRAIFKEKNQCKKRR